MEVLGVGRERRATRAGGEQEEGWSEGEMDVVGSGIVSVRMLVSWSKIVSVGRMMFVVAKDSVSLLLKLLKICN